jgi:DNA-binding transcriptional regulator WhiA
MLPEELDEELLRRLDRLMATVRTIRKRDRRLVLSSADETRTLLAALQARSEELAQKLNAAQAASQAFAAYARTAFLGCGAVSAARKR